MKIYTLRNTSKISPIARFNSKQNRRKAIDVLTGIALGIMADGEMNSRECKFLREWLAINSEELPSVYLGKLVPFLNKTSNDHEVSEEELDNFVQTLSAIIGFDPNEHEPSARKVGSPTLLIFDDILPCDLIFIDHEFAISGVFNFGSRKKVQESISALGGINAPKHPRLSTDYLIVGNSGSDQWCTSALGSKIERALELKGSGHPIKIIREEIFTASMSK